MIWKIIRGICRVGIFNFSKKAQDQAAPEPMQTLQAILGSDAFAHLPVHLRPADANQKKMMIDAVIQAHSDTWRKGGYILATQQDASDVTLALSENQIPYEIFGLSSTHELSLLRSFTHVLDDQKVIVYVDDTSAAQSKRYEDYKRFQSKIIDYCRRWDDEPAPQTWQFLPVFYVDINLPFISGFAYRMRQASRQFGTTVLSSKNTFDREVEQRINYSRDLEELRLVAANSVCIYGGGRRNYPEIRSALEAQTEQDPFGQVDQQVLREDIDRMKSQTILAIAAGLVPAKTIRLVD